MTHAYRFGDWLVEPTLNRLSREAEFRRIQPLAMDVLVHLLDHHDRVVSADELLDHLWPNRHGDPGMVKKRIAQIRHALGDDAKRPAYIESISRRGYRTIAPVRMVREEGLCPQPRARGSSLSIAVEAFAAGDRGPAICAEWLVQEITGLLAGYREMQVVSSHSAGDVAPTDPPHYVLSGTMRDVSRRRRLRVRLHRTSDGRSVWSRTFQLQAKHAAEEEARMAVHIARIVRLEIVKDYQCECIKVKSRSPEAAAAVCAAQAQNYTLNQGGELDPVLMLRYAKRAVELDPRLPEARLFVYLALSLLHGFGIAPISQVLSEARSALDRGLELDPENPLLLWAQGDALAQLELNYVAAEANLRRALSADPLHPNARWFHESLANLALRRGDLGGALKHHGRAIATYDSDAHLWEGYAYTLLCAGRNVEALEAADAGIELAASGGLWMSLTCTKLRALGTLGRFSQAKQVLDEALDAVGNQGRSLLLAPLAMIAPGDDVREAIAGLEALRNSTPWSYWAALGYAGLAEHTRSFDCIHRGIDWRLPVTMTYVLVEPLFAPLRDDARWLEVVDRIATAASTEQARSPFAEGPAR